ncbi:MAG: manganese efflux pump MntP family protein [Spirochaetia bacterium]|jgi:putative Mn2+ efflux pump MntP|nr:manganese efflux pump MntP family protein [Spirochaetia bacterium]
MSLLEIFAIAVSLSMDAFSVCVALGARLDAVTWRHYLKLSLHFGLFQFMMPIAGFYCGSAVYDIMSRFNHWAAFIILSLIGLNMIRESFAKASPSANPAGEAALIVLSIATSIDAAAAGLGMAALRVPVFFPAAITGIVCAAFSAAGLFLGARIGFVSGNYAGRFGGIVLIAIGVKILLQNLQIH